jgi:transposase InsO family protein
MEDTRLVVLGVQGEHGAVVRVEQFNEGRQRFEDLPMPVTDAEWLEWQLKDDYCRPILSKLDNSRGEVHVLDSKSAADTQDWIYRVRMKDGTAGPLQRRSTRVKTMQHKNLQVDIAQEMHQMVVPEAMVERVMWLIHDCMGHPGRNRTAETMRLKYHWPQVARDIKRHTQSCRYCNLRKANRQGGAAEIMTYDPSDRPGVRVHMDQCGPFPVSFNGAVYILVLKDSLTKFITLIALDGKDMLTVQNAYLTQYLAVFGAPQVLITDRGTEFHNSKAMGIAKLFGVRKISTTPNNPQSDGLAENQMGTLKDMLTSFISAHQRDWDEYLQVVAHSYNNTVNDATGFTPHFLTFGTEMGRVAEEHLQTVEFSKWQETVSADKEALMWCWSAVGERVVKNVERFKRAPVAPHAPHEYKTGDYCYLRVVPKRSHKTHKAEKEWILANKLQYRFAGPYCVTSQMSPILYRLRVHGKERVVHLRSMKAASKMEAVHREALKPVWEGPVELERPLTAGVAVSSVCIAGTWNSDETVEYDVDNWDVYDDVMREDCDTWREIMRRREENE